MTLPIITLTCTGCGLQQSSGIGGNHEYVLDDGRTLPVLKRSRWCHGCGCIRSIEVLDATRWLGTIAEVRDELTSVKLARRWWRTHLAYEGIFFGHRESTRIVPSTAHDWSKRLNDALAGLDLLAGRQSGPRCLSCGLEHIESRSETGDLLTHPGCNGTFEAEVTGDIMTRGPRKVLHYTSEGESLSPFRGDFQT